MRLERLAANKIKIILTSDDLFERGLSKEDIWKESGKWNQLFHDMLEEASEEFDVDIRGSVAVEIFSLQAQGIIMIITVDHTREDEEALDDGLIEMQVRVGGCEDFLYEFEELEDIIGLAKRLSLLGIYGGSLYVYRSRYFLLLTKIETEQNSITASLMSEFGNASILSPFVLKEYGKLIVGHAAIETLLHYFK